ncbi:peptidoglycan/LPS O-acetylase OafA/YrhL [Arthrobacter sp. UYCu511]|uniref:acyltransferase n=1 Tax=Arthrobacter sp. UYCu511 TaxID=3156337 RepID=UPI00339952D1
MSVPQAGTRLQWMDTLRGLAILLVLIWHAPAIPALFGYEMPLWLEAVNNFFLPLRMPTLMFLSGLLLTRSMGKGLKIYYVGKFKALLWPYLLWAGLHMVLYGHGLELSSPRAWIATGYLWFLFYITCYYMVAPLVTKLPAWLPPIALIVASIPLEDGLAKKLLYFAGFFFAGHLAMQHRNILAKLTQWPIAGYCGAIAALFGIVSAARGTELAYRGEFALFSLMGIVAAITLTEKYSAARWVRPVAFVGRNSLIYYVAHFPIILCVLYLVEAMGLGNVWLIAIPGLILSLVICTLLSKWRQVIPVRWLFQAPDPTKIVSSRVDG